MVVIMSSSYCNVCRICLTVCGDFMDIVEFAPAIMECAPIKILPNDGYPSVICEVCLDKLQAAQHFRVLCIQSDIILRQSNSEVTIGIPNGFEYDTNSMSSQDDNKPQYSHFMSCEIEYEPEILECDTIIIDDSSNSRHSSVKDDITELENVLPDTLNVLPPYDNTTNHNENNSKKELHKVFKCKKCGKKFKTKFKFRKHHKKLHFKSIPLQKCRICSRPIKNLTNLQNSNTIQRTKYKKNYCQYCCKIFSVKSLLWSDSKRHRTKYNCDNCEQSFKSKCSLLKHKQYHSSKVYRVLRSYSKSNSNRKK